jgi:glycosyltransferase involved in cell wall biosynthesis
MTREDTITIIVAAYNEAEGLEATIDEVAAAVEGDFEDYEIIIFDDASTDATPAIADRLAGRQNVRAVHNQRNMGLGWNYRRGLRQARMRYVTLVNGKHDIAAGQLRRVFAARGRADVVVPYHTNDCERPYVRQIVSRAFTTLLNVAFGYRLHYYNDSVLHRTETVRALRLRTSSYAFTAEALIKALRSGCSFVEVPIVNLYPPGAKTSAFRLRNAAGVAAWLLWMVWDVYLAGAWRGN